MKFYNKIIIAAFYSIIFGQSLEPGDTLILNPITWQTKSPEGWNAQYREIIDFPDQGPWRKVLMLQTLKCDSSTKGDEYPCGAWDYIWNTLIEVPKGDSTETFSIGSFVTPYGKRLELGGEKGWAWTYDMTDYAPILKGLREITVGNNQELLDLKFLFIRGIPTRNILKVENLYPYGDYKYSDLSDNKILQDKTVYLMPNAAGYKIKAIISGHGHAGPHNCCEWDSKNHTYYKVENQNNQFGKRSTWELFRWNVWKDCGNNPIYPQGGTWPFDRAGWCPGTKVDEYEFELTPFVTPGDSITIDYGIEPYSDNGEKDGFFYMTHQIFTYGVPNFKNDVELIEIISPSKIQKNSRENTGLKNPRILIKNTGEYNLRSIDIHYGLKNRKKSIFRWIGDIEFLEKIYIDLPKINWLGLKHSQSFEVTLKEPNGIRDENQLNNTLVSQIPLPQIFPKKFTLSMKTNNLNRARENSYTISNMDGTVFYSKNNFIDSTNYQFPIELKNGKYLFHLKDKNEDGLSVHWWNRNSTPEEVGINGEIQFLTIDGDTLQRFNPDFGEEIKFNFLIGPLP